MRKTIYALALLSAVITLTISSQSCSGEPLAPTPETVEPDTRSWILVADLTVTGDRGQILLEWDHFYNEPYDYIHIYRSESTPIFTMGSTTANVEPVVTIPMGTDPFSYTFYLAYLDNILEDYSPVYYQVVGVCVKNVEWVRPPVYSIKWMSPEVENIEWSGRRPPLDII
jgi:hypothetical protein